MEAQTIESVRSQIRCGWEAIAETSHPVAVAEAECVRMVGNPEVILALGGGHLDV